MAIGLFMPGVMQKNQDVLTSALFNSVCEFAGREVKIIDFYKINKLEKLIRNDSDILKLDLNGISDASQDWCLVYEACKSFLKDNDIDTVICYKTLLRGGFRFGDEESSKKILDKLFKIPSYCFNFASTKKQFMFEVFIKACSDVCDNFYQYVSDPQEIILGKVFDFKNFKDLYYNSCRRRGSIVMPFYEYQLDNDSRSKLGDQEVPFTFYCSAVTDDRAYIVDMQTELESIEDWDVNIGTRDREHKSMMCSQDQYMFMLSQSKCSLVIKPYDHLAFSWTRFVECLYNNCLPLVWNDCNLQDISTIFPKTTEVIREFLLVDSVKSLTSKVDAFCEDEEARSSVINLLRSSIASKHVLDIQWLKNRWRKLEGLS